MSVIDLCKKYVISILIVGIFCVSVALGLHNATLYSPKHGFDGVGHVFYIEYVAKHWALPAPNLDWETHQSPLYYIVGAVITNLFHTSKAAQYLNIGILWLVIGMVGIGLKKIFKNKEQVLTGLLALAALPMLNIFPAMVTNELLSTLWIVSTAVACLYLIALKNTKQFVFYTIWLSISVILGFWTKVSIITIIPTIAITYIYLLLNKRISWKYFAATSLIAGIVIFLLCLPVYLRSQHAHGPSNISNVFIQKKTHQPANFYYRLDWIPKIDMYNTQYYSLIGGAWNSFWSDGHNAITPFVKFHKKAFILWIVGFLLFPISLYGLLNLRKQYKEYSLIINSVGLSMIVMYVLYNYISNHYSAARLTYEMAIVLPYAAGVANIAKFPKARLIIWCILLIQFSVMISFFWIQPWWHVTK